jgi:hypothetical protein
MKGRKIAGVLILVDGLVILALSLFADHIWDKSTAGFGAFQLVGILVGAVLTVVSLSIILRK